MRSGKSTRSSRRATPRGGTKTKKTSSAGLDIMERDLKREKIKNQELSLELERVKRENERLHKKRDDAINVGVFDTESTDSKLIQMENLYRKKSRALQKSIEKYREEVKQLQAASTKSARSKQIQGLKSRLRDCELKVDVLKEELAGTSMFHGSPEERGMAVNELLIRKTIGGPKRFRPKTREELVRELKAISIKSKNDINELRKKHKAVVVEKNALVKERSMSRSLSNENAANSGNTEGTKLSENGSPIKDKEIINQMNEIARLEDKVAVLNRKALEQRHTQEKLSNQIKELKGYKEKSRILADELEQKENEIEDLHEQLKRVMSDNAKLNAGIESSQSSISRLQQMKDTSLSEVTLLTRKHNTELRAKENKIENLKERIKILERKEKEKAKVNKQNEDTSNKQLAIEKKRHEDLMQTYRTKEEEHDAAVDKVRELEEEVDSLKEKANKLEMHNNTKQVTIDNLNSRLDEMAETRTLLKEQIDKLQQDHKDERDKQHSSVRDSVERLRLEKDKAEDKNADLLQKFTDTSGKLENAMSKLRDAQAKIDELERSHETIKNDSSSSVEGLQAELNEKNAEIKGLQAEVDSLKEEKKNLAEKVAELLSTNKKMSAEYKQILNAQKIKIRKLEKALPATE